MCTLLKQLKKTLKHIQAWTRFPWPLWCRVLQCSYHWAIMPIISWSLFGFVIYQMKMWKWANYILYMFIISVLNLFPTVLMYYISCVHFHVNGFVEMLQVLLSSWYWPQMVLFVCSIFSFHIVSLLLCSPLSRIF